MQELRVVNWKGETRGIKSKFVDLDFHFKCSAKCFVFSTEKGGKEKTDWVQPDTSLELLIFFVEQTRWSGNFLLTTTTSTISCVPRFWAGAFENLNTSLSIQPQKKMSKETAKAIRDVETWCGWIAFILTDHNHNSLQSFVSLLARKVFGVDATQIHQNINNNNNDSSDPLAPASASASSSSSGIKILQDFVARVEAAKISTNKEDFLKTLLTECIEESDLQSLFVDAAKSRIRISERESSSSDDKFGQLVAGDSTAFFEGVSALVGPPNHLDLLNQLRLEHEMFKEMFTTSNYRITTSPSQEFKLLLEDDGISELDGGDGHAKRKSLKSEWPELMSIADENWEADSPRVILERAKRFKSGEGNNHELTEKELKDIALLKEEIMALRLYTGFFVFQHFVNLESKQNWADWKTSLSHSRMFQDRCLLFTTESWDVKEIWTSLPSASTLRSWSMMQTSKHCQSLKCSLWWVAKDWRPHHHATVKLDLRSTRLNFQTKFSPFCWLWENDWRNLNVHFANQEKGTVAVTIRDKTGSILLIDATVKRADFSFQQDKPSQFSWFNFFRFSFHHHWSSLSFIFYFRLFIFIRCDWVERSTSSWQIPSNVPQCNQRHPCGAALGFSTNKRPSRRFVVECHNREIRFQRRQTCFWILLAVFGETWFDIGKPRGEHRSQIQDWNQLEIQNESQLNEDNWINRFLINLSLIFISLFIEHFFILIFAFFLRAVEFSESGASSVRHQISSIRNCCEALFDRISNSDAVPFATTIHLAASAISKLSRVQPVFRLYRGINGNLALPSKWVFLIIVSLIWEWKMKRNFCLSDFIAQSWFYYFVFSSLPLFLRSGFFTKMIWMWKVGWSTHSPAHRRVSSKPWNTLDKVDICTKSKLAWPPEVQVSSSWATIQLKRWVFNFLQYSSYFQFSFFIPSLDRRFVLHLAPHWKCQASECGMMLWWLNSKLWVVLVSLFHFFVSSSNDFCPPRSVFTLPFYSSSDIESCSCNDWSIHPASISCGNGSCQVNQNCNHKSPSWILTVSRWQRTRWPCGNWSDWWNVGENLWDQSTFAECSANSLWKCAQGNCQHIFHFDGELKSIERFYLNARTNACDCLIIAVVLAFVLWTTGNTKNVFGHPSISLKRRSSNADCDSEKGTICCGILGTLLQTKNLEIEEGWHEFIWFWFVTFFFWTICSFSFLFPHFLIQLGHSNLVEWCCHNRSFLVSNVARNTADTLTTLNLAFLKESLPLSHISPRSNPLNFASRFRTQSFRSPSWVESSRLSCSFIQELEIFRFVKWEILMLPLLF